jgi:predicted MFS family arabinose efflux permease
MIAEAEGSSPQSAAWTILLLSFAPAIGLGLARFAYALVLPDMRVSLDWNYAEAGAMNTANAVGYLLGALAAAPAILRAGPVAVTFVGVLSCVAALALSAVSSNFVVLLSVRLLSGVGAALAFVAGGTLAAGLSHRHATRASILLSMFYAGIGIGIVLAGATVPLLFAYLGGGSWQAAWLALAAVAGLLAAGMLPIRRIPGAGLQRSSAHRVSAKPMLPLLIAYCAFGAGGMAYMTFIIAWVQSLGASSIAQAAFWSLLGLGAIASPWLWAVLIERLRHGYAFAVLISITLTGCVVPLMVENPTVLALSGSLVGSAMFSVVTATTAFVRRNLPQENWAEGIGVMTVAFGIGQIFGPIGMGLVTDLAGSLVAGLWLSAAALTTAIAFAAWQKDYAAGEQNEMATMEDRFE